MHFCIIGKSAQPMTDYDGTTPLVTIGVWRQSVVMATDLAQLQQQPQQQCLD